MGDKVNNEPNEETQQAITDTRRKKNLKQYDSLQEFAESLKEEVKDEAKT